MPDISFTFDTSHFEMSALKDLALVNSAVMSVTRDMSHSPIGLCGPFDQSPFGDSLRYVSTAFLSTTWDCGENAVTGKGVKEGLGGVERKH